MSLKSQVEKVLSNTWFIRRFGKRYWILSTEDYLCVLNNDYREWMGDLKPLYLPQKYLYLHYNKKNKKFCLYVKDKITSKMVYAICEVLSISKPLVESKGFYLTKIIDYDPTLLPRTKKGEIFVEEPKIGKNFVMYNGEKYFIVSLGYGVLDLSNKKIRNIEEIEGLKDLLTLRELNLSNNQITEIKGLEDLKILRILNLSNNQINEINGLENLKNLEYLNLKNNQITEIKGLENIKVNGYNDDNTKLNLGNNPIPEDILNEIGGLDNEGVVYRPNLVVEYCYIKKNQEIDSIQKLKKILKVSNRFRLDMMMDILNIDKKKFNNKLKNWSAEFGFKIDGEYLIINKETVLEFIDALDKQFRAWEKIEIRKMKKI